MENKIAWEKYPEGNKRKYFSSQRITASLFLIARQSASALLLLWRKQKKQVL
jgi:hypothetical protein